MTYNKIYVSFGALRKITGPFISYQYDVQQILVINGLNLPEYYEVDFCNEGDTYTETIVGTADGVAIPNKFLRTGKKVKAYLVLVGDGDVQTRYEITLPVNVRPQRQDIDPTDDQQLQIDALVAALNDGVSRAEDAASMLENASADAETLPAGEEATAEYRDGVFHFGIPEGQQGETGPRGETGERGEKGETGDIGPKGDKGDPFRYEDFTEAQKAELVQGPIKAAQNTAVEAVGTAKTNAVDAVNRAGTTAVNSVNQAGETQVSNVQTEGNTQVQAVADKGDEVIGSIPPDYSDLAAEVSDLNRQLSDLGLSVVDGKLNITYTEE